MQLLEKTELHTTAQDVQRVARKLSDNVPTIERAQPAHGYELTTLLVEDLPECRQQLAAILRSTKPNRR